MLSKFNYVKPASLDQALNYLQENEGTRILAGGTDLLVVLRRNLENVQHILDIKGIPETKNMEYIPGKGLFIGASVTANQIAQSQVVNEKYGALVQGVNVLASYQLRNRATVVGNICNASPGADLAAPLLLFDAMVQIAGPSGKREVNINEFFTGVKKTVLQKNEIVVGTLLPDVQANDKSLYMKQSRLKGHDIATVGVALRKDASNRVYIAMAAVAPTPIRLTKFEEAISAKTLNSDTALWAEKEVVNHIKPISDVRSSAEYRLHIAGVFLRQGLLKLMETGGK